jgi:ribonuclease BN (tRNA processing enzyme)
MRLTVIGSGTPSPHPARVCAGHLVEEDGVRILFDCGNGVLHRMATLGIEWNSLTHVALSHFHYDHIGDLPALIVALRWGQLPPRSEPLTIIGPAGTNAWLQKFADVVGSWLLDPETFTVSVVEVSPEEPNPYTLSATPLSLAVRKVSHSADSIAYSLTSARARFVYTGDTGYDETLADWAAGCDVLLTECSLPAGLAIPEHLTPESAGALAARAKPKRLVLSHFYPPVEREDIAALVGAKWNGPLVLANDGLMLDIG